MMRSSNTRQPCGLGPLTLRQSSAGSCAEASSILCSRLFWNWGKVRQTIFLCEYLDSKVLRQEIEEGLNVIENWNSANDFIWYGKGGEIATNNKEEQEI